MRTRLLLIGLPAVVISWSVYSAIRSWEAREEAREAEVAWKTQSVRVETTRRRTGHAVVTPVPGAQTALAVPLTGGGRAPSLLTAAAAAVGGGGGAEVPRRGAAGSSLTGSADANGSRPGEAGEPEVYPDGISPTGGATLGVVAVADPATPAAPAVTEPSRGEMLDRGEMIRTLRERFGHERVQVEEIRVSGPRLVGDHPVRTVKIKLLGKKASLEKALATLQKTPAVGVLSSPRLEPVRQGQMRLTVTGTLAAGEGRS